MKTSTLTFSSFHLPFLSGRLRKGGARKHHKSHHHWSRNRRRDPPCPPPGNGLLPTAWRLPCVARRTAGGSAPRSFLPPFIDSFIGQRALPIPPGKFAPGPPPPPSGCICILFTWFDCFVWVKPSPPFAGRRTAVAESPPRIDMGSVTRCFESHHRGWGRGYEKGCQGDGGMRRDAPGFCSNEAAR